MALIFCVQVAKCARRLRHRFRGQGERGRNAVGRPGAARRCEQPKDNCWDMPAGDRRRVRKGSATGERGDRGANADEPRGKQTEGTETKYLVHERTRDRRKGLLDVAR